MGHDLVVVGLGYVGLPLAARASAAGLSVAGFDVSAAVVAGLAAGRAHVPDVGDAGVRRLLDAGFVPTTDPSVIRTADVVVICVPTGLTADGRPDLAAVRAAAHTVAAHLREGTLVVLESTSHPGTTDEVLRPILEAGTGLTAGDGFHLGFSPERVDPGNRCFGIHNTPKIVSGHTPLCAKHCAAFYDRFVEHVVVARGTREAELAKLLENTYRYVNIALVNEVAMYCHRAGIDVWDVLHCAATKPFGYAPFSPGPGVGGHCIPVDPQYLANGARTAGFEFAMVDAARAVNAGMPAYVVRRAAELVDLAGARVLLLGVAYKPDVPDIRESPAVGVAALLRERGADVVYHDPWVDDFPGIPRAGDLVAELAGADLSILLQEHRCYDLGFLARVARRLFDTRGKVPGERVERL